MAILQRFSIDTGGAGTTLVAAAAAGQKHKVLGLILSLNNDGTWSFLSGATPLMGQVKQDGQLQPFVFGPSGVPFFETAPGEALSFVATQAADGVVLFVTPWSSTPLRSRCSDGSRSRRSPTVRSSSSRACYCAGCRSSPGAYGASSAR
jgi:hypothetical protein